MKQYKAVVAITLHYGGRRETWPPGTVLSHQMDTPAGNVWFIDPEGARGCIYGRSAYTMHTTGLLEPIPDGWGTVDSNPVEDMLASFK